VLPLSVIIPIWTRLKHQQPIITLTFRVNKIPGTFKKFCFPEILFGGLRTSWLFPPHTGKPPSGISEENKNRGFNDGSRNFATLLTFNHPL
jgi:hypothetical protein